jgi:4-hydroxybenzoate polyprenyltransferase
MMPGTRTSDAVQTAAGIVAGLAAPELLGNEALLWVLAALGICSLADVAAPPSKSRMQLAVRYLSSVAVTLAASWVAATIATFYNPEWRGELWTVRIAAALVAGVFLHPVIASSPRLAGDLWGVALGWLRGRFPQSRGKPND